MSPQTLAAPRTLLGKWVVSSVTQPLSQSVCANDSEYLAPRSLLTEHGVAIDLLSDIHICELFEGDSWFGQVFSSIDRVQAKDYDFVVVPSNKRRSLGHKRGAIAKLPWVWMHGFYTGPEFNRGDFAAQRLFDALEISGTEAQLQPHARQKLAPVVLSPLFNRNDGDSQVKVAFALGGVDPQRTCTQWLGVSQSLAAHRSIDITLLGSGNASESASKFVAGWPHRLNNQVGQTSLIQCSEVIYQQDLLFARDGGLMHLGVTIPTRLVSLFSRSVHPSWQLPYRSGTARCRRLVNHLPARLTPFLPMKSLQPQSAYCVRLIKSA